MPTARRLRRVGARLGLEADWYLGVVAALIGLLMSAVAMAFIYPLRWIEEWSGAQPMSLLIWLVPVLPLVGALLAGVIIHLIPGPGHGPGVSAVMYAIHRKKSRLPLRFGARKWVASTLTIGSGGSAGAEGPIVTIGSVIGANLGSRLGVSAQHTSTLLGCGAAAGLASVFNAPIAGIFFVMEILLRDFSLRTFTPIVIASVISAAATQGVLGDEALFATPDEFAEEAFGVLEIPNYFALGAVCALIAVLFVRTLHLSEGAFDRLRVHPILKPAIGGALLGLLGLAWILFSGADQAPQFFGNGYPEITRLLTPEYYANAGGQILTVVILLGALKAFATCLTIGSGGAGGLFAPSLLIGAATGGAFGFIVNSLGWFPSASPAHYALVGMGAFVAATTHAPLTAIFIVYEITQSYEIILPLMFAAVISTVVGRLLFRESVYTSKLTRLGVRLGAMSDLTILRRLSVQDVVLVPPVFVRTDDSAQRLLDLSEQYSVTDFVVVDDLDHYVGLVTGADLQAALVYREAIPLLQVNELQRCDLPTAAREDTLDVVLDKFSRHDVQSLAVLDEDGDGSVLGLITRSRLMRTYQSALSR